MGHFRDLMPHWLSDAPLDQSVLDKNGDSSSDRVRDDSEVDGARNKDVIAALKELFVKHRDCDSSGSRIRIGLFGGLGQGKTSAWKTAKNLADNEFESNQRGKWYQEFDISHYKQEALEHELDLLLAASRPVGFPVILAIIKLTTAAFLIISLASFLLSTVVVDSAAIALGLQKTGKVSALAVISLFLVQHLFLRSMIGTSSIFRATLAGVGQHWLRNFERGIFMDHPIPKLYMFTRPSWLIIDNLDRATEAQQRAVLRALYKHGQNLPVSVLVCMDETRLLAGAPAPESPFELLSKAIQLEIRMPGRIPLDACRLAWQMTATLRDKHAGDCCWENLLGDPRVVAGLARGLVLTGGIGPRYSKRLLNDVNYLHWQLARLRANNLAATNIKPSVALRREINCVENWLASLRILLLSQCLPALRNDNLLFAHALTTNDSSVFERYALDAAAKATGASENAIRIFSATRHWRPLSGEWLPFVANAKSVRRGQADLNIPNLRVTSLVRYTPDLQVFDQIWRCLRAVGDGYGIELMENLGKDLGLIFGVTNLMEIPNYERQGFLQALLLSSELYCLLEADSRAAMRVVTFLAPWENRPKSSVFAISGVESDVFQLVLWPALAARNDLADAFVGSSLAAWLRRCDCVDTRFGIASLLPHSMLGTRDRLAIAAEPGRSQFDELVGVFCATPQVTFANKRCFKVSSGAEVDIHFDRYWPTLDTSAPELFENLGEHLALWKERMDGRIFSAELPNSLRYLFYHDGAILFRLRKSVKATNAFLDSLRSLLVLPGKQYRDWSFDLWLKIRASNAWTGVPAGRNFAKLMAHLLHGPFELGHLGIAQDRILIRILLAASIGEKHLAKILRQLRVPSLDGAILLKAFIDTDRQGRNWSDSTWKSLFAHFSDEGPRWMRPILLLADWDSERDEYIDEMEATRKLCAQRPAMILETIELLLDKIERTGVTYSGKIQYLRDALELSDRIRELGALPEKLEQRLFAAKREFGEIPSVNTFNEFISRAVFSDPDSYDEWLHSGIDLILEGLDSETDFAKMMEVLTIRIDRVLSLLPQETDFEQRTRYALLLRTAALRNRVLND